MNTASTVFEEFSWDSGALSSDFSISCEYCLEEKSILAEAQDGNKIPICLACFPKVNSLCGLDPFEVTSLSWSCNGSSIAVSYGTTKDIPWGQNR